MDLMQAIAPLLGQLGTLGLVIGILAWLIRSVATGKLIPILRDVIARLDRLENAS